MDPNISGEATAWTQLDPNLDPKLDANVTGYPLGYPWKGWIERANSTSSACLHTNMPTRLQAYTHTCLQAFNPCESPLQYCVPRDALMDDSQPASSRLLMCSPFNHKRAMGTSQGRQRFIRIEHQTSTLVKALNSLGV